MMDRDAHEQCEHATHDFACYVTKNLGKILALERMPRLVLLGNQCLSYGQCCFIGKSNACWRQGIGRRRVNRPIAGRPSVVDYTSWRPSPATRPPAWGAKYRSLAPVRNPFAAVFRRVPWFRHLPR